MAMLLHAPLPSRRAMGPRAAPPPATMESRTGKRTPRPQKILLSERKQIFMPARTALRKKDTKGFALSSLSLEKVPTGIRGLDQVTHGGFPKGRTALVCGGPGTGKTLLGLEFLARGALLYNEPGVCIALEETADELITNMASLGYDLPALVKAKKLAIDYVHIERKQIEETGEYDLEGLFIRLRAAIDHVKAKRVLLDTIEVLFLSQIGRASCRE